MFKKIYLGIIFIILNIIFIGLIIINVNSNIKKDLIKELYNDNKIAIMYTLFSKDDIRMVLDDNDILDSNYSTTIKDDELENNSDNLDDLYLSENSDYKLINIKVGGYDAYLVAIYDPSKVKLIYSKTFNTGSGQEYVKTMCNRMGATVCINGGAFVDYGVGSDTPMGYLIADNKIIWSDSNDKESIIGFDNDNNLVLANVTGEEALNMGIRDALQFGPFLIVNGEKVDNNNYAVGGFVRAARVAIGQRKDGVVLFIVTDGTYGRGPTMDELTDAFIEYGAYNAANLDGGASSQLTIKGQLINHPLNIYGNYLSNGRRVVSGFGLFLN